MNKKINQICQKISPKDILNKKFYPVWFFTNEKINYFFPKIKNNKNIKKVFSIGGGGDFIFSLLSSPTLSISEINLSDIRQMANISIDFKIGLFKRLGYKEILNLFLKQESYQKNQVYKRIKKTISPLSRKILDSIIENSQKNDFLKCLKKSGLWYKRSFKQIKHKKEYLPYLDSKEKFHLLQKNLNKITIYPGDLNKNLKLFKDNYYDLIYISNILDNKTYCPNPKAYLKTIKKKLDPDGLLLLVTQKKPKKIIKLIKRNNFYVYKKQLYKFNIFSALSGHYSYSFLLLKIN